MGQLRVEKVQELMKQEVSKIILQELKDPRIGFVTVTQVEATGDLRSAKIYVSLYGSEKQQEEAWKGLQSCLGYFRTEIAKRIKLRMAPHLSFHKDTSMEYSAHIESILKEIKEKESKEKERTGCWSTAERPFRKRRF